jgi:hypothetical protein
MASSPTVVRLHQPIDFERFKPRGGTRRRARTVLSLSNYLRGERFEMLEGVCRDLGLELVRLGAFGGPILDPRKAMADADIIIGYGRTVLEGMAMGCAGYVWDYAGGDGWVTPETYPAIESDGFSGAAFESVVDADRLRADLAAYDSELGTLGLDLVRANHSAISHAEELVGLLSGASPPTPPEAFETLASLVRLEARSAIRADGLEFENGRMREDLGTLIGERDAARAQLDTLLRSRSWRLLAPFRRLAAMVRRR